MAFSGKRVNQAGLAPILLLEWVPFDSPIPPPTSTALRGGRPRRLLHEGERLPRIVGTSLAGARKREGAGPSPTSVALLSGPQALKGQPKVRRLPRPPSPQRSAGGEPDASIPRRAGGQGPAPPWPQIVTFIGLRRANAKTIVRTKKIHIHRGMKKKVGSSG